MRFSPKTEKQIQEERFPVLNPGKYHFEVFEASEAVSKKGNPMIVLKLKLLDSGFNPVGFVTDYLMESIAHKLRHASYVCGLGNSYEFGELSAKSFIGKSGMVDVGIQKDKTGQYPDRNSIQDYVMEQQQQSSAGGEAAPWEDMPEPPEWAK